MKYVLMHKTIEVAELTIDETHGGISSVDRILNPEHFPIGVFSKGRVSSCQSGRAGIEWGRSVG
ncbi:MAG: hypothetical protein ACSW75_04755 [Lachnospiraceae bacterium]